MKNIQISLWDESQSHILQQWQLSQPAPINVGRSPEHQIVIDRPSISRLHATIEYTSLRQGGGYWEIVNHSANGTFVNGLSISRVLLTAGDRLQLAQNGTLLTIELDVKIVQPIVCEHLDNPAETLFCKHCGQPITIIQQIGKYQILKTLGVGGMGTTYLAWDAAKLLVLKEMNADMVEIPKARELFEREAKILQNLHHPGIPQYYDFFVAAVGGASSRNETLRVGGALPSALRNENRKYLAMELIHGQDLDLYILEHGTVSLAQAIDWMIQLCEILGYIHQQQPPLIHRDVKPANILVRAIDRRIFLLDFGAVKEIGTLGGTKIGAPDYMAPEQNNGKPVTQSDLYAIGPTLIFLLTGRNPTEFIELQPDGYRFNLAAIPTITPPVQALIDRVTQRRSSDRYLTAGELIQALRQFGR
jgi:serine/threonine protein kinase, bacterial